LQSEESYFFEQEGSNMNMTSKEVMRFRRAYALPGLCSCPNIGELNEVNAIIALSFGRNSFPDKGLGRRLADFGARKRPDTEVFQELNEAGFDPGTPNNVIAGLVCQAVSGIEKPIPTYLQWEVAYSVWKHRPQDYQLRGRQYKVAWPGPDSNEFRTTDVMAYAYSSATLLRPRSMVHPLIVAHKHQIARVVAIGWKMGLEVVVHDNNVSEWDRQSTQAYTRRPSLFIPREIVGRLVHHTIRRLVRLTPPNHFHEELFNA
jgi:hypothetical protein